MFDDNVTVLPTVSQCIKITFLNWRYKFNSSKSSFVSARWHNLVIVPELALVGERVDHGGGGGAEGRVG